MSASTQKPSAPRRVLGIILIALLLLGGGILAALLWPTGADVPSAPPDASTPDATTPAPTSVPTFAAPSATPSLPPEPEDGTEDETADESTEPETGRTPSGPATPLPDPAVGQILSFSVVGDPEAACAQSSEPWPEVQVEFRYRTKNAVEAGLGIDTHDGILGAFSGPLDLPEGSYFLTQACDNPQTYAFTVVGTDGVHHTSLLHLFQDR